MKKNLQRITLVYTLWLVWVADIAAQERVHFSIKNPTLAARHVEFKYWNANNQKSAGYGYALNGLANHATTLPVGTRIYLKEGRQAKLLFVITAQDQGVQLNITKPRELSREQSLDVAYQEMNEKTSKLAKADDEESIEQMAQRKGLQMVTFRLKGSSFWPRQVYVRVQLPWDTHRTNVGFSTTMSVFSEKQVSYPVGAKVYSCEGAYWNGKAVKETLLLTVAVEKANYVFKL
jgi:hypothetical protein